MHLGASHYLGCMYRYEINWIIKGTFRDLAVADALNFDQIQDLCMFLYV